MKNFFITITLLCSHFFLFSQTDSAWIQKRQKEKEETFIRENWDSISKVKKVLVRFVVEEDGSVNEITIIRSNVSAALDSQAVRMVKQLPHEKSGVRVIFYLPISFR